MTDPEVVSFATPYGTVEGRSRAGHETWFRVPEWGVGLDIGRCPDALIHLPHIFITHAHLDHALGIPLYAGQRSLQGLDGGTVYVPEESAEDLRALMRIHGKLEQTEYGMEIRGLGAGDEVVINNRMVARAHQATHRVPARAYEFLERRHRLRPEYASMDGAEIARLRKSGVEVTREEEVSLLFYTGDTDRRILEQSEALFRARILIMECSYIAAEHRPRAAQYGHLHLEDILEFAGRFENEWIVLMHFSRRYERAHIREQIGRRMPAHLLARIRLALAE